MTIRFSVQADSEAECALGYQLLRDRIEVEAVRDPTYTFNSWLARAVLNLPPAPGPDDTTTGPQA
jgi:hypothetical protein